LEITTNNESLLSKHSKQFIGNTLVLANVLTWGQNFVFIEIAPK